MPRIDRNEILRQMDGLVLTDLYSLGFYTHGKLTSRPQKEKETPQTIYFQLNDVHGSKANFAPSPVIEMEQDDVISLASDHDRQYIESYESTAHSLVGDATESPEASQQPLRRVELADISMREETDITIEFIRQTSDNHHIIGYYLFNPVTQEIAGGSDNSGIIWLDSTKHDQTFHLENIPAGLAIGFFIILDGFSQLRQDEYAILNDFNNLAAFNQYTELSINQGTPLLTFNDGRRIIAFEGNLYLSHNHPAVSENEMHVQGGISFSKDMPIKHRGKLIFGFEYINDNDAASIEKVVFSLSFDNNLAHYLSDSRPIFHSIATDSDELLSSLTLIGTDLLANHGLYYKDENQILHRLRDSGTITINFLGKPYQFSYFSHQIKNKTAFIFLARDGNHGSAAPVEFYERLAASLFFRPDSQQEDFSKVLFYGYAIDENGIISNFDHVTYTIIKDDLDNEDSELSSSGYMLDLYLSFHDLDTVIVENHGLKDDLKLLVNRAKEINFTSEDLARERYENLDVLPTLSNDYQMNHDEPFTRQDSEMDSNSH